jgi:hypothetical protein
MRLKADITLFVISIIWGDSFCSAKHRWVVWGCVNVSIIVFDI